MPIMQLEMNMVIMEGVLVVVEKILIKELKFITKRNFAKKIKEHLIKTNT